MTTITLAEIGNPLKDSIDIKVPDDNIRSIFDHFKTDVDLYHPSFGQLVPYPFYLPKLSNLFHPDMPMKLWYKSKFSNHKCDTSLDLVIVMLTGKQFRLQVCGQCTAYDVQLKIQDLEGIPPQQQRLMFGNRQLQEDKMLHEYMIQSGNKITVVLRLRGGGCALPQFTFADVSNRDQLQKGILTSDAPQWRCITNGLNVEGLCRNNKCKAFQEMVIHQIGCVQTLVWDKNIPLYPCPECYQPFLAKNCGFYDCKWTIFGRKANGTLFGNPHEFHDSPKCYETFNPSEEKQESFQYICFQVLNLHDKYYIPGLELCVICFEDIQIPKPLKCGHAFHPDCLSNWTRTCTEKQITPSCPYCRTEIVQ